MGILEIIDYGVEYFKIKKREETTFISDRKQYIIELLDLDSYSVSLLVDVNTKEEYFSKSDGHNHVFDLIGGPLYLGETLEEAVEKL
jgi:hypothetical protein